MIAFERSHEFLFVKFTAVDKISALAIDRVRLLFKRFQIFTIAWSVSHLVPLSRLFVLRCLQLNRIGHFVSCDARYSTIHPTEQRDWRTRHKRYAE